MLQSHITYYTYKKLPSAVWELRTIHGKGVKPGFHYPSWRPELTARVDEWPVSTGARFHWPSWRAVTRQLGPLIRAVNSGSENWA